MIGLITTALGIDEEKFEKLKEKAVTLGDQIYDRATSIFDSLIASFTGKKVDELKSEDIKGIKEIDDFIDTTNNPLRNDPDKDKGIFELLNDQSNIKNNNKKQPAVVQNNVDNSTNTNMITSKGSSNTKPSRSNNAFNYNSLDSSTSFA